MDKNEKKQEKDPQVLAWEARLDQLGREWFCQQGPDNNSVRITTELEIVQLLYQLYLPAPNGGNDEKRDRITMAITDFWATALKSYDPEKGALSHYASFLLKKRTTDLYYKEKGSYHWKTVEGEDGKKRKDRIYNVSLDSSANTKQDGDKEQMRKEMLLAADPSTKIRPSWDFLLNEWSLELYLLNRSLETKLSPRQKSGPVAGYYNLFFTDNILTIVDYLGILKSFSKRERDLIQALDHPFLDHVKTETCRTLFRIQEIPLKDLSRLIPGHAAAETKLPLRNDVFAAYTGAAKSTISTHRTGYLNMLKKYTDVQDML